MSLLTSNLLYGLNSEGNSADICENGKINELTKVTCVLYYAPWWQPVYWTTPGYKMRIYTPNLGCSSLARVRNNLGDKAVDSSEIGPLVKSKFIRNGVCEQYVFGNTEF